MTPKALAVPVPVAGPRPHCPFPPMVLVLVLISVSSLVFKERGPVFIGLAYIFAVFWICLWYFLYRVKLKSFV